MTDSVGLGNEERKANAESQPVNCNLPSATTYFQGYQSNSWNDRQNAVQFYHYFYTLYSYYYCLYAQGYSYPARTADGGAPPTEIFFNLSPPRGDSHLNRPSSYSGTARLTTTAAPGVQVIVAPVRLRLFAELLDFLLLFLVKDVIYHLLGMPGPELILEQSADDDANVMIIRNIDQVVKYTLFYRILVFVYETLFLAFGLHGFGGATIGKRLVGISVIRCDHAVPLGPRHCYVVQPGGNIGLRRSVIRSLLKSMVVVVAYPVMVGIMFSPTGRTMYDVLSSSLVVVTRRMPLLQQQQHQQQRPNNAVPNNAVE